MEILLPSQNVMHAGKNTWQLDCNLMLEKYNT